MSKRPFPQPTKLGSRCTRWPLSEIEKFEKGETSITSRDEVWLSDLQLAKRFGVHRVCIWTWAREARESAAEVTA